MTRPRHVLPGLAAAALLALPAAAMADDCGIEGSYFSGRSALTVTGSSASFASWSLGSEGDGTVSLWSFGPGAPRATTSRGLSAGAQIVPSTLPVVVTRPDGTREAILWRRDSTGPIGIVARSAASERVLVPGVLLTEATDLGAAMAPDGSLVLAYVASASYDAPRPTTMTLVRIAPDGTVAATRTVPGGSFPKVAVGSDGTATVFAAGAKAATRWAAGAEPVAVPLGATLHYFGDSTALDDGHGGAWLRTSGGSGYRALHVGPAGAKTASFASGSRTPALPVVDRDGDLVVGYGRARVRAIAPDGTTASDRLARGAQASDSISAVAVDSKGRVATLLSRTRAKKRTVLLVRGDGTTATIAAKARNHTAEGQLAVLPSGTAWAVWQDSRTAYDQICSVTTEVDVSVQAARVAPAASRATAKALKGAFGSDETSP